MNFAKYKTKTWKIFVNGWLQMMHQFAKKRALRRVLDRWLAGTLVGQNLEVRQL
jgi:hypothetical protein